MTAATRLAAPAPDNLDDDVTAEDVGLDDHIAALCEQWAGWCWSRRYFGRSSLPPSLLGRLVSKTRPLSTGPDAICSAHLHAFHLAVLAQPEALDRQVFELHYLVRPKNIKAVAPQLGVSRRHWYTLVRDFRRRVYAASQEILGANLAAAAMLPSIRAASAADPALHADA